MATIKQFNNLAEEIEYGALANSCGFGQDGSKSSFRCIADEMIRLRKEVEELKSQLGGVDVEVVVEGYTEEDTLAAFNKEADKYGATAEQRERGVAMLKKAFEDEDPASKAMTMARDAVTRVVKQNEELAKANGTLSLENHRLKVHIECLQEALEEEEDPLVKENEELKRKVLLQQEAGYYCHTRPAPDCEINTDDAAFDHYWSVQDNDLTLWKVPRHLADVKSAQTSYHGAVEQAFYDECFGEEYGKLKWMRVREMKQADLIKAGWQPKADDEEKYAECDECGRFCYTGGHKYPNGYVCADCDEDEENSEDDE
jgi:hypothetical protein